MSNESNYCALEIELDMAHAEEQYINKRSLKWSTHGHRSRQGTTKEHVEENLMGKFHMIQTEIKKAQDHVGYCRRPRFLREIKGEKNYRSPVVTS